MRLIGEIFREERKSEWDLLDLPQDLAWEHFSYRWFTLGGFGGVGGRGAILAPKNSSLDPCSASKI